MAIASGKLFHEVTIEQRNDSRNAYGESIASWATCSSPYAEVRDLSGNELVQASQINSKITTRITVRYDSGIRATMRVVHKSRNYNIISVQNELERDEKMILLCQRLEDVTNG